MDNRELDAVRNHIIVLERAIQAKDVTEAVRLYDMLRVYVSSPAVDLQVRQFAYSAGMQLHKRITALHEESLIQVESRINEPTEHSHAKAYAIMIILVVLVLGAATYTQILSGKNAIGVNPVGNKNPEINQPTQIVHNDTQIISQVPKNDTPQKNSTKAGTTGSNRTFVFMGGGGGAGGGTSTTTADTTAPTINIIYPANNSIQNTTGDYVILQVNGTATDNTGVSYIQVRVNGGTWQTSTGTNNWNITLNLSIGSYNISVKVYDTSSNPSDVQTINITVVYVDVISPTINITSPVNNSIINSTIDINATASDNVGVEEVRFFLDGAIIGIDNSTPYSINWSSVSTIDGQHNISASAIDTSGNNATSAIYIIVNNTGTPDNTPPIVGLPTVYSGNYSGGYFKGTISLRSTISDFGSGLASSTCKVNINGTGWTDTGVTQDANYCYYNTFTPAASFNISFRVNDTANNTGTSITSSYSYDTTIPTTGISGTAPAGGGLYTYNSWTSQSTVGNVLSCNDGPGVGCKINGTIYCIDSSNSCNPNTTYVSRVDISAEGTSYFRFRSNDTLDNQESINNVTIKIDTINPAISYNSNTDNGGVVSRNNIIINITSSDTNYANTTIRVYNSTGTLVYNTTNTTTTIYLNYTTSTDGIYYFNATAYDLAGRSNNTGTRNITTDTTNPSITYNSNSDNGSIVSRSYVIINITSTDTNYANTTIRIYNSTNSLIYNTTNTTTTIYINYTLPSDGIYYYNATAYDNAGNSNNTNTRNITIDTIAPTIALNSNSDNGAIVSRNYVIINITSTDTNYANTTIRIYNSTTIINTTTTISTNIFVNYTVSADGLYYYNATAYDIVGHTNTTNTRNITIDTINPTINISYSPSSPNSTQNITFTATAGDTNGISSIKIFVNNSNVKNCTTSPCNYTARQYANGTIITYFANATDNANNTNQTATANITITDPIQADTTPPTISITTPANNSVVNGTIDVNATASDNIGVVNVLFSVDGITIANDTINPYTTTWDSTSASNGLHNISATAYDTSGNNATSKINITINNTITSNATVGANNISSSLVLDMPFNPNGTVVKDYSAYSNNGTNNGAVWKSSSTEDAGVVLSMSFDNDNSTTIIDDSGIGNSGVKSSGVTLNTSDCIAGSCYTFDGSGDIDAGNKSSLDAFSEITLSAWIKPYSASTMSVISKGSWYDSYTLGIRGSDGYLYFPLNGPGGAGDYGAGTPNLFDGSWHNIVATYNGTDATIYIDGLQALSHTSNGSIAKSSGSLTIGSGFKGNMDDIKIYNKSLTQKDVQDRYDKVRMYYSPNYKFNGASNYINVKNSSSLNIGGSPIAVSAWVYWKSSTESYNSIVEKDVSGTGAGYALSLRSDQKIAWKLCNAASCISVDGLGGTVGFNNWHHIVGVYDGENITTYIDGTLDYTTSASLSWGGNSAENLTIGGHSAFGSGRYFNGLITNVQVYNRSLTAFQTYQVYSNYLAAGHSPNSTYYNRTFYISSSTGNDSNDGLTSSTAWKSIEKIYLQSFNSKIYAGDSFLLRRGDSWEGQIKSYRYIKGLSDEPVTIGAYGTGAKPIIYGDGRNLTWTSVPGYPGVYSAYVGRGSSIWGVYEGNDTVYTQISADGLAVSNDPSSLTPGSWEQVYVNTGTMLIQTVDGGTPKNIRTFRDAAVSLEYANNTVVEDLDIREAYEGVVFAASNAALVQRVQTSDTQDIAILFADACTNSIMQYNQLNNSGNTALYLTYYGSNNTIRNNTIEGVYKNISGIYDNRSDQDNCGIGLHTGNGDIIEYNKIYDTLSGGIDFYYEDNSDIRYNYMTNSGGGIYPHGTNLTIYGNIIIGSGGNAFNTGALPINIFHNTFVNGGITSSGGSIVLRDNLYYDTGPYPSYDISETGFAPDSDYNCYAYNSSYISYNIIYNGVSYNLPTLKGVGSNTHSVFADGKLNPDYTLSADSGCRDMGVDVSSMINFPYKDYNGTNIPQGSAPDAGVYEYFGNGTSDVTAPNVTISSPSNNSVVNGTIDVNATASDNVGVSGVQFMVDGSNIGSEDTSSPYSISWDSSSVSNGAHNLSATARDAAGNNKTATINITVNNVAVFYQDLYPAYNSSIYGSGVNTRDLTNYRVDAEKIDYRFRALHTGSISSIRVYAMGAEAGYGNGTGGIWKVTLRTDDGSSNHWPTQTNLTSMTHSLINYSLADPDEMFPLLTFGSPANVTSGTLYHIVFENIDPAPMANYTSLNTLTLWPQTALNPEQPFATNLDWNTFYSTSPYTTWNIAPGNFTQTPIMEYYYTDNYSTGMSYMEVWSDNPKNISGGSGVGETFTVSGSDRNVTGVKVWMRKISGTGSLNITLERTNGTLIEQGSVAAGSISTTYGWVSLTFLSAHDLGVGQGYNLKLSAPSNTVYDSYPMAKGSGYKFTSNAHFPDGYAQFNDGTGWVGWDMWGVTNKTNSDLEFYFTTVPVSSDTTPPTVSITAPANNSVVNGTIDVNATASDNVGVVGVQFLLDGSNIGSEDTLSPYSISWDSSSVSNGTHNISATARDAAGNTKTAIINITVNNSVVGLRQFYVSTSGNDSNDGLSSTTPWKTISKVNSYSFSPGDRVLFNRGDVWREQLTVSSSGTAIQPIIFDAYGTGSNPIISGADNVTGWTLYNGSIYVANVGVMTLPSQLYVDGVFYDIAHYPHSGYLNATSNSANTTSIIDSNLALTANQIVGSTVQARAVPWRITPSIATAYISGSHTILLSDVVYSSNLNMRTSYGFYLQNMLWMLDSPGAWVYNSSSGKLYLWTANGDNPSGHTVEVSNRSYAIVDSGKNHVIIRNLTITYANQNGISVSNVNNLSLKNLNITGGDMGVYFNGVANSSAQNNIVQNALSYGIRVEGDAASNINIDISNNLVNNTGNVGTSPKNSYAGIDVFSGTSININNNTVINNGYLGIEFFGDQNIIQNNVIDRSCLILDDCGGIYNNGIYDNSTPTSWTNIIRGNTVSNSIGNFDGTDYTSTQANGIYLDSSSYGNYGFSLFNNTISNVDIGIYVSNGHNDTVQNNSVYGARMYALHISENSLWAGLVYGNVVTGNTFEMVSSSGSWLGTGTVDYYSEFGPVSGFGTFNNNLYCHPNILYAVATRNITTTRSFNLTAWQAFSGQDSGSTDLNSYCPRNVTSDNSTPTVSITYPINNSIVDGIIDINATASDNLGVSGVQFLLDGSNIGSEDTSSPYSISWDSSSASNGAHNLSATARDAAGNNKTTTIHVTVNNAMVQDPYPAYTPSIYGSAINALDLTNERVTDRKVSFNFRALHTGSISSIRVYAMGVQAGYGAGNGGVWKVTLRNDDNTSNHWPVQSNLTSMTHSLHSYALYDPNEEFPLLTFDSPASITAGTLYHIVFENIEPDPINNFVSLNTITMWPHDHLVPFQPFAADSDWGILASESPYTTWSDSGGFPGHTPIMEYYYTDNYSTGMGYMEFESGSPNNISGISGTGETFTVTGKDRNVTGVKIWLRKISGSGDLTIRLEQTDGTLIEQGSVSAGSISTDYSWINLSFQSVHNLTVGQGYNFKLSAPSGTIYDTYMVEDGSCCDAYWGFTPNVGFSDGYAIINNGSGWTGYDDNRTYADLQFYFTTGAVSSNVTLPNGTGCANLNVTGVTYNVTTNLSINNTNCFNITAASITLNCQGYTITGNNVTGTYGILSNSTSTNVKNCNINNFSTGIYFNGASNGTIQNSNANTSSGRGIYLTASSYNNVTNSTGSSNPNNGIFLDANSNFNTLTNVVGISNSNVGINIQTSSGNMIVNTTGISIGSEGILLVSNSNNNNIINATATSTYIGLEIMSSSNNTVTNTRINANSPPFGALCFYSNAQNNTVANSTINGQATTNNAVGFNKGNNTGNILINNTILNATTLLFLDANASKNIFYWNNFTATNGVYVNDTNGTNYYNATINGQNEGNVWYNVMNGSVIANGSSASTGYPNLYVGTQGSGYPYNTSTSQGKFICGNSIINYTNCADYRPLIPASIGGPALNCSNLNIKGTYNLTNNVSINGGTCFTVTAENVTLNCNGFSIIGDNTLGTYGIYTNKYNTTIQNCVISGFDVPILVNNTNNCLIQNVNAQTSVDNTNDNSWPHHSSAIVLSSSSNSRIENSTGNSTHDYGIIMYNDFYSIMNNSRGYSMGESGIFDYASSYNNLTNNYAWGNTLGLYIRSSDHDILTNVTAVSSGYGIQIDDSTNTIQIINSTFQAYDAGVYLTDTPDNIQFTGLSGSSVVTGILINGGTNILIDCQGGNITGSNQLNSTGIHTTQSNTTVKNCNLNGFNSGIYFDGAMNGTIQNNNINVTSSNVVDPWYASGIFLDTADYNTLNNNTAYSTNGFGIYILESSYNTLTNSTGISTNSFGIRAYAGTNNTIINSTGISGTSQGMSFLSISNYRIINSTATSTSGNGIDMNTGTNTNILKCQIIGQHDNGALLIENSANNTIANNTINGLAGGYTIGLSNGYNNNNIFINNTIINATTLIYLDANTSKNKFYWNNFTGTGAWVENYNATNMFNTTNSTGTVQGNRYFNITGYNISDSNSDGWGDSGTQYPVNSTKIPGKWIGLGADYGPRIS